LIIDAVSLEIPSGALVGILGPNGSGKTTLLRLLAGTLTPDSGDVRLDGESLSRWPRALIARRCAVVPQDTHLAFDYTALEIALMGRYPHLGAFEFETPDDIETALRALESTGTRDLADRGFQTLSGGEKQRVVIASALAQLDQATGHGPRAAGRRARATGRAGDVARVSAPGPEAAADSQGRPVGRLLLLDEPTASLDLRYQMEIARLVRRLPLDHDIGVVLSTHDLRFASALCTELVLLKAGRVLAKGPVAEVLTREHVAELYDLGAEDLRALASAGFAGMR
jgi:iron complex transport system ATP-binding protein